MPEWIKATRESAGYYADDPPQRPPYPPTCRERQDEAIAKLAATLDLTLGICEAIGSELAELRARVVALEADAQADVRFVLLELVRDDGAEDELDDQCAAYERIPQSLDRSNTNQTYSWLPGDALSQYCADVEARFVPPPTHGRCGPGETTITWTAEPPPLYTPGYPQEETP
jgi:hypothetical protein